MTSPSPVELRLAAGSGDLNLTQALIQAGVDIEAVDSNKETALHHAAVKGHSLVVRVLIAAGANVNAAQVDQWTPLHFAAQYGHTATAAALLNAGANIEAAQVDKWVALHIAARNGHAAIVDMLLKAGANVEARNKFDSTALIIAASEGHDSVVNSLITTGSNVDAVDVGQWTALYVAARNGHSAIVATLLNSGANVDFVQVDQWTALHVAARNGHTTITDMLLNAGANIEAMTSKGSTALIIAAREGHESVVASLITAGVNVNGVKVHQWTALHFAACRGHEPMAIVLLNAGAKVDAVQDEQWTPLHYAAQNGHAAVVNVLVNAGANIEARNNLGCTALTIAASHGQEAVVSSLVAAGANVEAIQDHQWTSLHYAAQKGHAATVAALLNAGSNVNAIQANQATALSIAAQSGHAIVVRMLIDAGADPNAGHHGNSAPLILASQFGHNPVVSMLVSLGANLEVVNDDKQTAIACGSMEGHSKVVCTLIEAGAKIDVFDKYNFTPLMWAAKHGHLDATRLLINAGANLFMKDKENRMAQDLASQNNHTKVTRELVEAVMNEQNEIISGSSAALWRAIRFGNTEGVRLAVAKQLVEIRGEGRRTPLMVAAENNQVGVAKLLLFFSSKSESEMISERDSMGKSVLHYGAKGGSADMVRLLLAEGANPLEVDDDNITPVIVAAICGHVNVVRELCQHLQRSELADVEALGNTHTLAQGTILHHMISKTNATMSAVAEIIKYLLSTSLVRDANATDSDGWTPLHGAASRSDGVQLVEALLDNGADANLQCRVKSKGDSAIHLAASMGHLDTVRCLLNHKSIHLDLRNERGETPLLTSVKNNRMEVAILLLEAGADFDACDSHGQSVLLHASLQQSDKTVKMLLEHGARVDCASDSGETPLSVSQSDDIRSVLKLYQTSQHFHDTSLNLLTRASSGVAPSRDQLMNLIPLITSAYDLRAILALGSILSKSEADSNTNAGVLRAAFRHIITEKLVIDDDACVFFRLVLEHCIDSQILSPSEYMKWKLQASKVNMEGADWVVELKQQVNENSQRMKIHDHAIRSLVDGIHAVHSKVMENRKLVMSVADYVKQLHKQVETGSKVLKKIVEHSNEMSDHVNQIQEQLTRTENNIQNIASNLHSFRDEYVKRLQQQEHTQQIKTLCGLVASVVGFAFAPLLKTALEGLIDLANPVDIFNFAYKGENLLHFISETPKECILKPVVQNQLEKYFIPVEDFESVLRQDIIIQRPDVISTCEARGLDVIGLEIGYADEVRSLLPMLKAEEVQLIELVKKLDAVNSVLSLANVPPASSNMENGSMECVTSRKALRDSKSRVIGRLLETESAQPNQACPAGTDEDRKVRTCEPAHADHTSRMVQLSKAHPPQLACNANPKLALSDGETIAFVEDLGMLPYHAAVCSSRGEVKAFKKLIEGIEIEVDNPNAVTMVRRFMRETTQARINAAEYAALRGFYEIGNLLAAWMDEAGVAEMDPAILAMSGSTVTLLENVEDFAHVHAVQESEGDVAEFKDFAEVIEQPLDVIHAKIRAQIIREELVSEELWSAVQLACHFGYVSIVKYLLVEKRVKTDAKNIVVLKSAKQRAEALAA